MRNSGFSLFCKCKIKSIFKILLIAFGFLLFSCTTIVKGLTNDLTQSLYRQNDPQLVKEGAPAYLLLVEGLISSNPDSKDLLLAGLQMFSAYSGAFIKDEYRKDIFADKTKKWAVDLLKTYPKFKKYYEMDYSSKEEKDRALDDFISSVKSKDVPYVFWSAYSWALYILANLDSPEVFIELPIPRALIDRIYEIDDTFYYGAPHLFKGIFYGAYPEAYGGDLKKAKEEFEAALKLSGDKFLMTKLFYADFYYKPKLDRENYVKMIDDVIDADVDAFSDMRLLNTMAQEQARQMREKVDEIFFDDMFNFDEF